MPSPPPIGPSIDGDEPQVQEGDDVHPCLLFTENETNFQRLYGGQNESGEHAKDAFHDYVISSHRPAGSEDKQPFWSGRIHSSTSPTDDTCDEFGPRTPYPLEPRFVNPDKIGTKAAAHYVFENVPGNGGCAVVRAKLTPIRPANDPSLQSENLFDDTVEERREEADEFYDRMQGGPISEDLKQIKRQALAGMLWSKQFYMFIQKEWAEGDAAQPPPPSERKWIRNRVRVVCPLFGCMFMDLCPRNGDTCISKTFCRCPTSK